MPASTDQNRVPTPEPPNKEKDFSQKIDDSIRGKDKPMSRNHPRAPGTMIWLTYPIALVIVLLIAIAVLGLMWSW